MLSRFSCTSRMAFLAGKSFLPSCRRAIFTAPVIRHAVVRCGNACNFHANFVRTTKLPFASCAARQPSNNSSSTSATNDTNETSAPDPDLGDINATAKDGDSQVTVSVKKQKAMKSQYRWKYNRSFTPGDLRQAANNDEPVYFMVTPPDQPDPGLLTDIYLDTTTLEWLYSPPISVATGQSPEHMNLSTVLVLYHPSSVTQEETATNGQTTATPIHLGGSHTFAHDYYMFTSYVLPAGQLKVGDQADHLGLYPVHFKVTSSPSPIYYEYNSLTQRYALFETRAGSSGPEKVYLVPIHLPASEGAHNRKVIRGKLLSSGDPVPEEYYTFMAFSASITVYIQNLPTV